MTANNQAVSASGVDSATMGAADTQGLNAISATVAGAESPEIGTCCGLLVTKVVNDKTRMPFLLKGFLLDCPGCLEYRAALHVSALAGHTREERDARMRAIKPGEILFVEVVQNDGEVRVSERLVQQRLEVALLMQETKVRARVLEDVKDGGQHVFVLTGSASDCYQLPCEHDYGHKVRLHVSKLKDATRDARDARITTLKKGDVLDVVVTNYRRHATLPILLIEAEEFGRVQRKPALSARPRVEHQRRLPIGPSPLGNKTGDRAKAEAKRAERRQRDQELRNKMKTSGGKK